MLNIFKPLKSQQVHAYHKNEYANSTQKNYYTEDAKVTGHWHGKLAEEMGLKGPISSDHFLRLADGQHPITGDDLVRHRFATADSVAHRAGWDATFSAPKTVSITALVGGDQAVIEAHRQARAEAIDYLERHTAAHLRAGNQQTGKWVAAIFEHDTSRPVNGYCAPQLHDHVVFFNVTTTPDGEAHALEPRHIFAAQKAATAVYQARLAYNLRQLGYEIEVGKNGAPEITGYSAEYLQKNSSRSEEIEQVADKLMKDYGLSRPEARQRAAHSTREKKTTKSREEIRGEQLALARQYGNQHEAVLARAKGMRHAQALDTADQSRLAMRRASKALSYAIERQFEREAVVSEKDILRDALHHGRGHITLQHVEHLIAHREKGGELLFRHRGPAGERMFTTPEMLTLEKENLRLVQDGQNTCSPLLEAGELDSKRFTRLNAGQQAAAKQILACPDQVQALQGGAGTGKTTLLQPVVEELKQAGYTCKGLAPTSRATRNLEEAGLECTTLQKHLATTPGQPRSPTVYFLDETSLASTKQVNELIKRLGREDRVILIGDTRQHESVEAGRVFAQLQEHGITTARLEEIVRQSQAEANLREAVSRIAAGEVREGFRLLQQENRVIEIQDEQVRYRRIADEYLKAPSETLVVSADNRSRAGINAVIHDQLKTAGRIGSRDYTFNVLVENQDVTGADRKTASSYEVGNILRYNTGEKSKGRLGIKHGDYATVSAVNAEKNEVTVVTKDGRIVAYDPERFHGVSIFRQEERAFAIGERVQFTAPTPDQQAVRRDLGYITAVDGSRLNIKLDSGRELTVDTNSFRHLDHGYAVTSYSSQSLTFNNTILNVDVRHTNPALLNKRHALVAATRERFQLLVITDDATRAPSALSKDVSKSSAIPAPRQQLMASPTAQVQSTQKTAKHQQAPGQQHVPAGGQTVPSQTTRGGQRLMSLDDVLREVEQTHHEIAERWHQPSTQTQQTLAGPVHRTPSGQQITRSSPSAHASNVQQQDHTTAQPTASQAAGSGQPAITQQPGTNAQPTRGLGALGGLMGRHMPGDVQQEVGGQAPSATDPIRLVKTKTPAQAIVPGERGHKHKEEITQNQTQGFGF